MNDHTRLTALSEWYQTDMGKSLYQFEATQLQNLLSGCFGYQLLQIGGSADLSWLDASPIHHKIWLAPLQFSQAAKNCFYADAQALPFLPQSIDVIFLPHVLECMEQPEVLLREAYETLMPGGYLIITGLNVLSLWGLQHLCKQPAAVFPWLLKFQRLSQLQKQLIQLDCVIDMSQIGYFLPLTPTQPELQRWRLLDVLGSICWPALGASYIILARKQIAGMTPIRLNVPAVELGSVKIGLAQQSRSHD